MIYESDSGSNLKQAPKLPKQFKPLVPQNKPLTSPSLPVRLSDPAKYGGEPVVAPVNIPAANPTATQMYASPILGYGEKWGFTGKGLEVWIKDPSPAVRRIGNIVQTVNDAYEAILPTFLSGAPVVEQMARKLMGMFPPAPKELQELVPLGAATAASPFAVAAAVTAAIAGVGASTYVGYQTNWQSPFANYFGQPQPSPYNYNPYAQQAHRASSTIKRKE